jgi:hypothetical protein
MFAGNGGLSIKELLFPTVDTMKLSFGIIGIIELD